MVRILPSIFAADIMNLQIDCDDLKKAGFKTLHIDMMDGHFVPHIAFGTQQVKQIKRHTDMTLDIHMMVSNPELKLQEVIETGAEMISIHYEATYHAYYVLSEIKRHKRKAGIVLNPGTPPIFVQSLLPVLDYILIMSINPGRSGENFLTQTFEK